MDAVEKANSGHPGMPMGMADAATVLFTRFMKFDAADPAWPDRDRFVLSAGHGSMLLYSLLHLLGYPHMGRTELERFRQLDSRTPGHPEYGHTPGVETTTGPLGQGLAAAVGMAIAERLLAARYGADIADHRTYVIAGDGCLMEGISHEAIALAGHLKLSKLIVLWDDNGITIDGKVSLADSVDQLARFEAAGWTASRIDGHDPEAVAAALEAAQAAQKPVLIACKTTIGYGAPTKAGSHASHGAALGKDEVAGARGFFGWTHAPFEIPDNIRKAWAEAASRAAGAHALWSERLAGLDPATKARFEADISGAVAPGVAAAVEAFKKAASEGGRGAGDPHLVAETARQARSGAAQSDRRISGSHGIQQHQSRRHEGRDARRFLRPLYSLRRSRIRHGRGHERHPSARRLHPLRRHVSRFRRLQPPRHPPRRADGHSRHSCAHP